MPIQLPRPLCPSSAFAFTQPLCPSIAFVSSHNHYAHPVPSLLPLFIALQPLCPSIAFSVSSHNHYAHPLPSLLVHTTIMPIHCLRHTTIMPIHCLHNDHLPSIAFVGAQPLCPSIAFVSSHYAHPFVVPSHYAHPLPSLVHTTIMPIPLVPTIMPIPFTQPLCPSIAFCYFTTTTIMPIHCHPLCQFVSSSTTIMPIQCLR
ncbi:unnamed protein product [Acanthosepion pharaonis]|uniref:Uncharacterized protein n=1 Tax=Acanthosepion pharaonis TaxID=158019 RepID=A0A812EK82_ACAPH|nr:unnamed protein product [Sepia pharaonis]